MVGSSISFFFVCELVLDGVCILFFVFCFLLIAVGRVLHVMRRLRKGVPICFGTVTIRKRHSPVRNANHGTKHRTDGVVSGGGGGGGVGVGVGVGGVGGGGGVVAAAAATQCGGIGACSERRKLDCFNKRPASGIRRGRQRRCINSREKPGTDHDTRIHNIFPLQHYSSWS